MENETTSSQNNISGRLPSPKQTKPAVGIIVRESNTDRAIRAILRAQLYGHEVLVTYDGDPEMESVALATEAGAQVVHPNSLSRDDAILQTNLSRMAREYGFSGLLLHSDLWTDVDYESSTKAVFANEAYAIEAERIHEEPNSRTNMDTLVAIPAYREATTIGQIVETARQYVDEVLVIDDGSGDDTATQAREAGATVICHQKNAGYGAALKTAFVEANRRNASQLIILDGDGQHDANDIPRLLEKHARTNANIVIGSRFLDEVETSIPFYRRLGLSVINFLTNMSLSSTRSVSRISDTQSGFRVFDRTAISSLATDESIGEGMSASTDVLYHAHKHDYAIEEIGTSIRYGGDDTSTYNPVVHGFWLVKNIVTTVEFERPFAVLSLPGMLGVIVGFAVGYWTVSQYLQTDVFSIVLGLISVLCLFLGSLLIITGVILQALNRHLAPLTRASRGQ